MDVETSTTTDPIKVKLIQLEQHVQKVSGLNVIHELI
jgi:hypothetical protein